MMKDAFIHSFNTENGQSDVYISTDNRETAQKYLKKGWKIFDKENHYYLRAPSVSLVDLTDPSKLIKFGNLYEAFAYHKFIFKYVENGEFYGYINYISQKYSYLFNSLEIFLVDGPVVESEFRLTGSDDRIITFSQILKMEIENELEFKKELELAYEFLGNIRKIPWVTFRLKNQNKHIQHYFQNLKSIYFDISNVYNDTIFYNMFKDCNAFDKYLVSPNGCFKYLSSLIYNKMISIDKIMFYETHSDPNRKSGKKYNFYPSENETTLVIDSLYSGNSVKNLSTLTQGAEILGMYPKSRISMQNCDYVMICDKIVKIEDINPTSKWYYYEFKKALSM